MTPSGARPAAVRSATEQSPGRRLYGRRALLRLGLGAGVGSALAACSALPVGRGPDRSSDATPVATAPPARGRQGGAFRVILPGGTRRAAAVAAGLAHFNERNDASGGLDTLDAEPAYWSRLRAAHAAGNLGDVVWAGSDGFHALAVAGLLRDIGGYYRPERGDLDDLLPTAIEATHFHSVLYGLPWGSQPGALGLLYNVDLVQQAGVRVTADPTTFDRIAWDQLVEIGKAVTGGGSYGLAPRLDYVGMSSVIGGHGAEFLSPDGSTLTLDSGEFRQGLHWLYDLFWTHRIAPPVDGPEPRQLFTQGKLAMLQTGYAAQFDPGTAAIGDRFRWAVGLLPRGPAGKRSGMLTIEAQAIWARSRQPELAWRFIRFLLDPDENIGAVLAGDALPTPRDRVLDSQRLRAALPSHRLFADAIVVAEAWREPANFRTVELERAVEQGFYNLWRNRDDPEHAIAAAKPRLLAVLDKPIEL